jgi:DNA-binding SARP family transcriptional activator/TolB-like protein
MVRLHLLGAVELRRDDGAELHSVLAQPKRTAVLAYLASSRGYCRRDRLLGLLWPELDEARARNALSKALHHLRRSIADQAIIGRGDDELKINGGIVWCDVAAFDDAISAGDDRAAVGLYRGALLESFYVPGAPEYERWLDEERTRLRRAATEAAGRLSEASRDPQEAVRWARRSHALCPDEELQLRRLLLALLRAGERAEAVDLYHSFAERLRTEYELEPATETQAVLAELQATAGAMAVPHAQPQLSAPPAGPHPSVSQPSPLHPAMHERAAASAPASPGTAEGPPAPTRGAAAEPAAPAVAATAGSSGRRFPARLLLTAGLVGAATVAALAFLPGESKPAWHEEDVLVASFENRTGDPALDVLGDMAADWVSQGLQETGLVRVVDRNSALLASRAVADAEALGDPERIAALFRESGAGTLITGAVYAQGDSLVLHARVVGGHEQRVLQVLEPIFTAATNPIEGVDRLRNQVAGAVAALRDRRMASISAVNSRPPNLEAYRAYIQGMELHLQRDSRGALPHFEAAMRADSTFYQAHFWALFALGSAHIDERTRKVAAILDYLETQRSRMTLIDQHAVDYFAARRERNRAAQYDAAAAAAALAPGSHWSWNAGLLAYQAHRLDEAMAWFDEIDPEHGWAKSWPEFWNIYTFVLHLRGHHERELDVARRARRIDAQSRSLALFEARALVALGRVAEVALLTEELPRLYDRSAFGNPISGMLQVTRELIAHGHDDAGALVAQAAVERVRVHDESRGASCDSLCELYLRQDLGWALYFAGDWDEATRVLTALIADHQSALPHSMLLLATVAARRGDEERALQIMAELLTLPDPRTAMWEAAITGWLGDYERAARALSMEPSGRPIPLDHLHPFPEPALRARLPQLEELTLARSRARN